MLKFSAMEIYNESVRDLLSTDSTPLRLLDDPEVTAIICFFHLVRMLLWVCFFFLVGSDGVTLSLQQKGTVVERLTEETLTDMSHLMELLAVCEGKTFLVSHQCLFGFQVITSLFFYFCLILAAQRQIGETALNETSSRSHQILRLVCTT